MNLARHIIAVTVINLYCTGRAGFLPFMTFCILQCILRPIGETAFLAVGNGVLINSEVEIQHRTIQYTLDLYFTQQYIHQWREATITRLFPQKNLKFFNNLCKQFIPRSGLTERWVWSGSNCYSLHGLIYSNVLSCTQCECMLVHKEGYSRVCASVREDNPWVQQQVLEFMKIC